MESEPYSSIKGVLSGTSVNPADLNLIIWLPVLLVILSFSALMSAAEIAYFSLSSDELKKLRSSNGRRHRTAVRLHADHDRLMSTILSVKYTMNSAFFVISSYLLLSVLNPAENGWTGFVFSIIALVPVLMIAAGALPGAYAAGNHVSAVLLTSLPLTVFKKLFFPMAYLLVYPASPGRKGKGNGRTDDLPALDLASDNPDDDEKILKGIANFGNINVSAIMCPRMDVTAIDIKSGFDRIIPVIIESGFSRIPVYAGSFDSVKGILYAKDVLPYTGNQAGFKWQSLLRPSYFVPETKKINDLLKEFQLRKIHMAVVIDEYGGTSGIVTLEDILEEIVGEITDESDEEETLFRKTGDNSYIFEGKILLGDFCRITGTDEELFSAVRGETETLAGLMLELTGEIPQKDRIVTFRNFTFRIESVDRRRIRQVRVDIKNNYEGSGN